MESSSRPSSSRSSPSIKPDVAIQGIDLIFHTAGLWDGSPGGRDRMFRLNVDGTQAVLNTEIPTVYTSSSITCGFGPLNQPVRKTSPMKTAVSLQGTPHSYRETKLIAEEMVREAAAWMVNPDYVIGPGDVHGVVTTPLIEPLNYHSSQLPKAANALSADRMSQQPTYWSHPKEHPVVAISLAPKTAATPIFFEPSRNSSKRNLSSCPTSNSRYSPQATTSIRTDRWRHRTDGIGALPLQPTSSSGLVDTLSHSIRSRRHAGLVSTDVHGLKLSTPSTNHQTQAQTEHQQQPAACKSNASRTFIRPDDRTASFTTGGCFITTRIFYIQVDTTAIRSTTECIHPTSTDGDRFHTRSIHQNITTLPLTVFSRRPR